jgi:hypothetical protein
MCPRDDMFHVPPKRDHQTNVTQWRHKFQYRELGMAIINSSSLNQLLTAVINNYLQTTNKWQILIY